MLRNFSKATSARFRTGIERFGHPRMQHGIGINEWSCSAAPMPLHSCFCISWLVIVFWSCQQVPELLPVQTHSQSGVLLENTMPTSLMVASFAWSFSEDRSPECVQESAESLKALLASVSRGATPLSLQISPAGGATRWQEVTLTDSFFFPADSTVSFFAREPSDDVEYLRQLWNGLLATHLHVRGSLILE